MATRASQCLAIDLKGDEVADPHMPARLMQAGLALKGDDVCFLGIVIWVSILGSG
jgi:hypothetical protein